MSKGLAPFHWLLFNNLGGLAALRQDKLQGEGRNNPRKPVIESAHRARRRLHEIRKSFGNQNDDRISTPAKNAVG